MELQLVYAIVSWCADVAIIESCEYDSRDRESGGDCGQNQIWTGQRCNYCESDLNEWFFFCCREEEAEVYVALPIRCRRHQKRKSDLALPIRCRSHQKRKSKQPYIYASCSSRHRTPISSVCMCVVPSQFAYTFWTLVKVKRCLDEFCCHLSTNSALCRMYALAKNRELCSREYNTFVYTSDVQDTILKILSLSWR